MSPVRRTPDRRARLARTAVGLSALLLSAVVGTTVPASAAPVTHEKGLRTWWYTALNLEAAHRETTGQGVKIAVIDEAIDPDRPRAAGRQRQARQGLPTGTGSSPARGTKADHGTAVTTLDLGHRQGQRTGWARHPRGRSGRRR